MTEQRMDVAAVKAQRTDEGFIVDTPTITRTGVFPYRNADGTMRYELRHPDDVFKQDSLNSIKGKPITDMHQGLITAKTAKGKTIGSVLTGGRQDGENVVAEITIHDTSAVDDGNIDLSCGYTLDVIREDGEYNGQAYTHRQTNIFYNHLAIVPSGRAGNSRLNLDAADDAAFFTRGESMKTIRLDNGVDYDVAPEVAHEIERLRQDKADVQATATAEKARADAAEQARADLDAQLPQIRKDAADAVKGRLQLEADAKDVGAEFNQDSTDREIKVAVIGASGSLGWQNLEEKDDTYIQAAFDMALEAIRRKRRDDASDADEKAAGSQRQDAANKSEQPRSAEQIRQDMIDKGEV